MRLGNLLMLQQELASSQQDVESLARVLAGRMREVQAMNKQQSNFIAVVSHEFRTTLTSIQGFSELLAEQEWSADEVKEYASDISTDAKRLTRMINEVLDLECMKSGQTTLRREPVDINALLRTRAEQVQSITPQHTIICTLDETLPLVDADQDQLIQVITNLLCNAVKYSPAGGIILLRSQSERGMPFRSVSRIRELASLKRSRKTFLRRIAGSPPSKRALLQALGWGYRSCRKSSVYMQARFGSKAPSGTVRPSLSLCRRARNSLDPCLQGLMANEERFLPFCTKMVRIIVSWCAFLQVPCCLLS